MNNNADNHQGEIVFDYGNVAEEVARQRKTGDPSETAERAEHQEQTIAHRTDTRHKRGEGADDGKKAREDDGLAAVFGDKTPGSFPRVRA